jgi:ATP-dependent helicase HrpB
MQDAGRRYCRGLRRANRHLNGWSHNSCKKLSPRKAGDVLVFLPGAGEIRRLQALLESAASHRACASCPLFGDLAGADQDAALAVSAPGTRKIVLATNIAETSLTIEGVRIVVDSGTRAPPGV